jgi:hypothetical protein
MYVRMPSMNSPSRTVILRLAFVATCWLFPGAVLFAQWDLYLGSGIPKNPDGSINLSAPAPRMANGKPDLSGVWQRQTIQPTAGDTPIGTAGESNGVNPYFDIGFGLKGGLPLTPSGAEIRKQRIESNYVGDPDGHCLPLSTAHLNFGSDPRKIIQTPGLMVMIFETNLQVRQIYTDGRPLPKDPQPWWYGYSLGRWEGDTLIVTTTHLRDGGWLDAKGTPLTDAGTITERFRRVSYGNLEIEMTVEDPKMYTQPWTVQVKQHLLPGDDLIEFICLENEKDIQHYVKP